MCGPVLRCSAAEYSAKADAGGHQARNDRHRQAACRRCLRSARSAAARTATPRAGPERQSASVATRSHRRASGRCGNSPEAHPVPLTIRRGAPSGGIPPTCTRSDHRVCCAGSSPGGCGSAFPEILERERRIAVSRSARRGDARSDGPPALRPLQGSEQRFPHLLSSRRWSDRRHRARDARSSPSPREPRR